MPLQTRENNVHFQLHRVLTVKPTGSLSKVTHYPASLQPWWYSWQPETATHVSVDIVQIKNTRRGWGLPGRDALCKQPRLKTQHSWHPPPDKNDSTDEDKKSQNYLWSQISFVPISPWDGRHVFMRVTRWLIGPCGTTKRLPHGGCSHIEGRGRGAERGGSHPSMKGHAWHEHVAVAVLESEPASVATGRKPWANHSLVIPVLTVQKYTQKRLRPTSYETKSFI